MKLSHNFSVYDIYIHAECFESAVVVLIAGEGAEGKREL
jgi:hypothetical protein